MQQFELLLGHKILGLCRVVVVEIVAGAAP
jgi:hypothetical protein